MNILFKTFLPIFLFISTSIHADNQHVKNRMLGDLEAIKRVFEVKYAPVEWKKNYAGWDLEEKIQEAKDAVQETPNISIKEFQRIVKRFFNSTKDYHAEVMFYSTETASLPFHVKEAEKTLFCPICHASFGYPSKSW